MFNLKRSPMLVADHKVMDGINAARMTLPRVWFDRTKCEAGLETLRQYAAEFDEKMRAFKDNPRPVHWSNHAADAFRYLCMAWKAMTATAGPQMPPGKLSTKKMTVNDLLKTTRQQRRWE
jgi:hypothetical protein